jgi:hypothetical protein
MLVSVPGFAAAWESAKRDAQAEIENEEEGRSLPKRGFAKLFPTTLPASTSPVMHREEPEKVSPEPESP